MNLDIDSSSSTTHTDDLKTKLTKERRVRHFAFFENMLASFTASERLFLYACSTALAISVLVLLAGLNSAVSVPVPLAGGTMKEGVVGPARFINPLLVLSQPDQDLTALVYSGLMRALPDGSYVPDLATRYDISEDGTEYTFTLRSDASFHDGTPLTAADVLFTIALAQNPMAKSVRRADWEGVRASSPDDHTVVFTLPHAYAPFIENTTIGILPKHLWQSVAPEELPFSALNTHPVGSGPYRVTSVDTDSTGAATRYDLEPFKDFVLDGPYLKRISFVFFPNEEAMIGAWNARNIDSIAGISPAALSSLKRTDAHIVTVPLPRTFGIFFNQNHASILTDASVRAALSLVDTQAIVDTVLGGYGTTLEGPIPPGIIGAIAPAVPFPITQEIAPAATSSSGQSRAEAARALLAKGGWKFDESEGVWKKKKDVLSLSLATADEPELVASAEIVAKQWRDMGAQVDVQIYSLSELNTNVIRPRSYDALLFGEVVGRSVDLFAFWHSSQRNDPGLNLSMYANSRVDALLAEARTTTDMHDREALYKKFQSLVADDTPAVFLYAPHFIYVVPEEIKGIQLGALSTPAERFLNVYQWYTQTELIWSIFSKQ